MAQVTIKVHQSSLVSFRPFIDFSIYGGKVNKKIDMKMVNFRKNDERKEDFS
jgi:hypothetical protein